MLNNEFIYMAPEQIETSQLILAVVLPVLASSMISLVKVNFNKQTGRISLAIPRMFPFVQDTYTTISGNQYNITFIQYEAVFFVFLFSCLTGLMIYNLLDLFGLTKIISNFAQTWVSYLTTPTGISINPSTPQPASNSTSNSTVSNSTVKSNSTISNSTVKTNSTK